MMKKEQLSDALNLLDEDIIAAADETRGTQGAGNGVLSKRRPEGKQNGKRPSRAERRPAASLALAACLALVVAGFAAAGFGAAGLLPGTGNGGEKSNVSDFTADSENNPNGSGGAGSVADSGASADGGEDSGASADSFGGSEDTRADGGAGSVADSGASAGSLGGSADGSADGSPDDAASPSRTEEISVQIALVLPESFDGTVTDAENSDIVGQDDTVRVCMEDGTEIIRPDGSVLSYDAEAPDADALPFAVGDTVSVRFDEYSAGSPVCVYARRIEFPSSDLVYRTYEHGFDLSVPTGGKAALSWNGTGIPDRGDIQGVCLYDAGRDSVSDITETFFAGEEIEITQSGHYMVYAVDGQGEMIFLDSCIQITTSLPGTGGSGATPL